MSELERLGNLLGHILATLDRIEVAMGSRASGASSVEVKTSTRGYDITTKAYNGSPIQPAGDAAVIEFMRVAKELEQRLMGQQK